MKTIGKPGLVFWIVLLPMLLVSIASAISLSRGGTLLSPKEAYSRFIKGEETFSFEICSQGDMFGDPRICKIHAENDGHEDCIVVEAGGGGGNPSRGCHSTLQCVVRCNVSNLRPE